MNACHYKGDKGENRKSLACEVTSKVKEIDSGPRVTHLIVAFSRHIQLKRNKEGNVWINSTTNLTYLRKLSGRKVLQVSRQKEIVTQFVEVILLDSSLVVEYFSQVR